MIEILLIEDDPVLGKGLQISLEIEGYKVSWQRSLKEAVEVNRAHAFHLIILDINLPDGSGISFLSTLRQAGSRIPVIVLTAKTDEDSVVDGLQAGANDYVKKPFSNKELMARIKTVLREPQSREPQMRYGDILILLDKRKAMFGEKEIELNRREFDVLSHFVKHAEAVVTRDALLASLDRDGDIFDRTVDSHVSHVRARLRQAGIHTLQITSVYGVGYRLEKK